MPEIETSKKQQSPAKLALAAGLTVVFVVVVVVQVKTYSGDAHGGDEATALAGAAAQRATVGSPLEATRNERPRIEWPKIDLAECTKYDPFATPEGFLPNREPAVEQNEPEDARKREIELARKRASREQAISKLQDTGVQAILKGPDHSVAILGTDTLRVGEEIHGHRVIAIESDGIILEPIPDQ